MAHRQLRQRQPSNTFWGKQYNVWANPEQQENRYLQFEKWWGDFVCCAAKSFNTWSITSLLATSSRPGNRHQRRYPPRSARYQVSDRLLLLAGGNITPPQQALDWILDCYENVEEIRRAGQTILYCLNQKVGHLAIFVGTEVAAKEHAEFMNYMELIDSMPPGLYEIVIAQKPGRDSGRRRCQQLRSEHRGARTRGYPGARLQFARGRARVCGRRPSVGTHQRFLPELPAALGQGDDQPAARPGHPGASAVAPRAIRASPTRTR